MFFCCEICEAEFRNMIAEVKRRTGWVEIDEIKMDGDSRLRNCTAHSGNRTYSFSISFNTEGGIRIFTETSPQRNVSHIAPDVRRYAA
jgi:hypothetical protein